MRFPWTPHKKTTIEIEMGDDDILLLTTDVNLSEYEHHRIKKEAEEAILNKKAKVVILQNMTPYIIKRTHG